MENEQYIENPKEEKAATGTSRPDAISDSGEAVAQAAHSSLVPSHSFAVWIMKMIRQGLDAIGFHHNDLIEELIYAAIVLVMAIFIGWMRL